MKCSAEDIHIIAKRGRDEVAKATHNEIEAYDLKRLADLAADKARIEARANKIVEEKLSKAAEEVKKII